MTDKISPFNYPVKNDGAIREFHGLFGAYDDIVVRARLISPGFANYIAKHDSHTCNHDPCHETWIITLRQLYCLLSGNTSHAEKFARVYLEGIGHPRPEYRFVCCIAELVKYGISIEQFPTFRDDVPWFRNAKLDVPVVQTVSLHKFHAMVADTDILCNISNRSRTLYSYVLKNGHDCSSHPVLYNVHVTVRQFIGSFGDIHTGYTTTQLAAMYMEAMGIVRTDDATTCIEWLLRCVVPLDKFPTFRGVDTAKTNTPDDGHVVEIGKTSDVPSVTPSDDPRRESAIETNATDAGVYQCQCQCREKATPVYSVEVDREDYEAVRLYALKTRYQRLGETEFVRDLLAERISDSDAVSIINTVFPDKSSPYVNIYGYYDSNFASKLHEKPTSAPVYAMYVGLPSRVIRLSDDTPVEVRELYERYPHVSRDDIVALFDTVDVYPKAFYMSELVNLLAMRYPQIARKLNLKMENLMKVDDLLE